MENSLEIKSRHGLIMHVGKLIQGSKWSVEQPGTYVNVTTFFEPLAQPILILEINACKSVRYLSNVAYYGLSIGGFSAKLKESTTLDDFIADLMHCIKQDDERRDLDIVPSHEEQ